MTDWYELSEMTSPEVDGALENISLALIPVGATEQHGPNLELGADYSIAHGLAQQIAAEIHPEGIVIPPLPFGVSDQHMDFAGTISISSLTFQTLCLDVIRSLSAHGLHKFLFVNGHQGNMSTLAVLASRIRHELGLQAATVFWMVQARDAIEEHRRTERWGHACEIETSIALALKPALVRTESLEPGDLIEEYGAFEDNYKPYAAQVPKPFSERTRNGAFGDATRATREAGEQIVSAAVQRAATFARDFIEK